MIDFSDREKAEKRVEEVLEGKTDERPFELVDLDEDNLIPELYNAVLITKKKFSWVKNVNIENRKEEKQRFLEAQENGEDFEPDWEFKEYPWDRQASFNLVDALIAECQKIGPEQLDRYGFEELSAVELEEFWQQIFEDFRLFIRLASHVEDREKTRKRSLEYWPMVEDQTVENSRQKLEEGFEIDEEEKNVTPEQLGEMFRDELSRLGIDYEVEVQEIGGSFFLPERKKLVCSAGVDGNRMYTENGSKRITLHEAFHVARGFNGNNAGKNDFPPVLGVHTPQYGMTEEGGAVFREHATGLMTPEQEKDYHVKLMAAYFTSEKMVFQKIVERIIDFGVDPGRAFHIASLNRQYLRHHIYQGGYYEEWKDRDEKWPLLIGKVNTEWAERFRKEVESGGAIRKPEVGEEQLFNSNFT